MQRDDTSDVSAAGAVSDDSRSSGVARVESRAPKKRTVEMKNVCVPGIDAEESGELVGCSTDHRIIRVGFERERYRGAPSITKCRKRGQRNGTVAIIQTRRETLEELQTQNAGQRRSLTALVKFIRIRNDDDGLVEQF